MWERILVFGIVALVAAYWIWRVVRVLRGKTPLRCADCPEGQCPFAGLSDPTLKIPDACPKAKGAQDARD